ncbi:MAG: CaiB/BaiF CoA-transferase family protein [Burkholderiaceae bacterium]
MSTPEQDAALKRQAAGPRPLDGITVVSLEHAIAAPFCTRQLADLGARVIKVERPGVGDFARGYDERVKGLASHFVWTNRSKESLALDLKHPDAAGILGSLLERADILVQNLAPGAAARLGLSFEALHERHPRLIVCDISGYGEGGPYQDKKAYDLLIQSEGGFLSVTGGPDSPAKAGCSISDIAAGMYAYSSILSALLLRERTGLGSRLDVSMLESMVEWMGFPMYYAFDGAPPPPRAGASHATIFPYGPFPAGDGSEVMLGLQNEREWAAFCKTVLCQPELADDARFCSNTLRAANKEALRALIVAAFASLSRSQVLERLEQAGIANASLNTMSDVWAHPQLAQRGRWREVGSSAGPLPALIPPATNSAFQARMDPIPALGEHSRAILAELGYTAQQITAYAEQGII